MYRISRHPHYVFDLLSTMSMMDPSQNGSEPITVRYKVIDSQNRSVQFSQYFNVPRGVEKIELICSDHGHHLYAYCWW